MEPQIKSNMPIYSIKSQNNAKTTIRVLACDELKELPEEWRDDFKNDQLVTIHEGKKKTIYCTPKKVKKVTITEHSFVEASSEVQKREDYLGLISSILCTAFNFSRKTEQKPSIEVNIKEGSKCAEHIIKLAEAKNRSKEWANGRGDIQGTPAYFEHQAFNFAQKYPSVKIKIINGEGLVNEGFRLLHAVGRASKNTPAFVNLAYNGNPESDTWIAFVGKGVCFDSGGLDIKPSGGMRTMYLDKHGACSVLSAFQAIVEEGIKANVTCSIGLVQNSINQNAYRPMDIIKSRKGPTVQIGNTDAEGRLVLADCMHWTQQNYKTQILIEQSTLTGAIVVALGTQRAGMFGNDSKLMKDFTKAGTEVNELVWEMPCDEYHQNILRQTKADIASCQQHARQGGSCQAAAFLKIFVQEGTKWIHLDIAGAVGGGDEGNGYGSRILVQYIRNYVQQKK